MYLQIEHPRLLSRSHIFACADFVEGVDLFVASYSNSQLLCHSQAVPRSRVAVGGRCGMDGSRREVWHGRTEEEGRKADRDGGIPLVNHHPWA